MRRSIKYTKEEDAIILEEVTKCPANLRKAFRIASERLQNRSEEAIHIRYYKTLKNDHTVFMLSSNKSNKVNTKNVPNNMKQHSKEDFETLIDNLASTLSKLKIIALNTKNIRNISEKLLKVIDCKQIQDIQKYSDEILTAINIKF